MNNTKIIPDYSSAGGIDSSQDLFLLWQNSTNTYRSINRNTILGVNGQPVDTSTVQTISNKIIDNTNTINVKDTLFTLQDDIDTTKQARFQLSGITTATTRTYTLPNASSTLADISTAQTFTNKTLTSPVITGGSITNSSISVDSISEFTATNGVTVDGLNIKDGKLNSNNSVVTANITNGSITPEKLVSGSGSGWLWQSWIPVWTNLTIGNGTQDGRYIQTGNTIFFRIFITFGSTSAISGAVNFTPPVPYNASYNLRTAIGNVAIEDAGVASFYGVVRTNDTALNRLQVCVYGAGGTYVNFINLSSTIPMTWGSGDQLMITGSYEV